MQQGRGGMASHKHHIVGRAGPSRWQKWQWAKADNALRDELTKRRPSNKTYATVAELMRERKHT